MRRTFFVGYLMLFYGITTFAATGFAAPVEPQYVIYDSLGAQPATNEEDCWFIDLEALIPSSKWSKRENQGKLPWCAGYMDANVVTFENGGESVSGSFLAIRQLFDHEKGLIAENKNVESFRDERGGETLETCEIVKMVNENGFCPQSALEDLGLDAMNILAQWKAGSRSVGFIDYASDIVNKACASKLRPIFIELRCGYFVHAPGTTMVGTLDRLLEQGFMPALTFNEKKIFVPAVSVPDFAPHGVPVTGRRWNREKNRCEYKIRNSLSISQCEAYNENVTCTANELVANEFWISSKTIEESTYQIAQISADKKRTPPKKPAISNAPKNSGRTRTTTGWGTGV